MEMSLFNCISTCLILTILTCNQIQLLGTKNPSSDSFNKIHQVFKYMKCWEEKDSSINLDNNSSKSLYCSLEKCKGLVGKKKKKVHKEWKDKTETGEQYKGLTHGVHLGRENAQESLSHLARRHQRTVEKKMNSLVFTSHVVRQVRNKYQRRKALMPETVKGEQKIYSSLQV